VRRDLATWAAAPLPISINDPVQQRHPAASAASSHHRNDAIKRALTVSARLAWAQPRGPSARLSFNRNGASRPRGLGWHERRAGARTRHDAAAAPGMVLFVTRSIAALSNETAAAAAQSLEDARFGQHLSPAAGRFALSRELLLATSTLKDAAAPPLLFASITSAVASGFR
jgi:hypothetical protein